MSKNSSKPSLNWPEVELEKVSRIVSGSTPSTAKPEYWNGNINWVTPAELSDGHNWYYYETKRKISVEGLKSCSAEVFPKGTVMLTTRAPIGKVAIAGVEMCSNQGLKNFICNKELILPEYLYFWLRSKNEYLNSLGRGATFTEISKSIVSKIKIPLPSLATQKKIVSILIKSEQIREKRGEADILTKSYLQSVFYELFGDPAINNKKFPIRLLKDAASNKNDFVDGPFGSDLKVSHQTEMGVRILQINNIGVGKFLDKNKKYVSEEKYQQLIRHNALPGDIIIAKMGEPIARTCILPQYITKALVVADCMRLRVTNKKEFDATYLAFLLNSDFAKQQIDSMTHGSTRIRINLTMIKSLRIPLPPISLQQKFALLFEQVEKLRVKQQKSKLEIENMSNSLKQEAFNGEIIC